MEEYRSKRGGQIQIHKVDWIITQDNDIKTEIPMSK